MKAVQDTGLTSIVDMPAIFPTEEMFLATIPNDGSSDVLRSMWLHADELYWPTPGPDVLPANGNQRPNL